MISSHEPTAPEVDALRAELAEVKAERDDLTALAVADLTRRGEALERAEKAEVALAESVLLRAALVGDITDLRDLMARRATTAGDDYAIPALVTADGVAAALTTILNQEQS